MGYRYEGTGRSLSLKLIQQLREQGNKMLTNGSSDGGPAPSGNFTASHTSPDLTLKLFHYIIFMNQCLEISLSKNTQCNLLL